MKTALFDTHISLGAKMVEFGGWEMPIQYKGIIHEHQVVRKHVGLFDVSHMGRILIEGNEAESFLDYLSTNTIANKPDGSAAYTVWCRETGFSLDDLLIYKLKSNQFFVVVNASNRQKDLAHLIEHSKDWNVTITDTYQDGGLLALQGPKAVSVIGLLFPEAVSLKHMRLMSVLYQSEEIVLSRTGYTGEDGFEIYGSNDSMVSLFHKLLMDGKPFQIEPVGLGARDTLRLEMGYALYGHEISESITPLESVSAWTVKLSKSDFLGKTALEMTPPKRFQFGVVLKDKAIAREGYDVFLNGQLIGKVTSGTFSPSLNVPVAIVLVEKKLQEGDSIEIQIRQTGCLAVVVKLPFYQEGR